MVPGAAVNAGLVSVYGIYRKCDHLGGAERGCNDDRYRRYAATFRQRATDLSVIIESSWLDFFRQ